MKKIYLASPFFSEEERGIMERVLFRLRSLGYEVYAPYEHIVDKAWEKPNPLWAREIFHDDRDAINEADWVYVIDFGMNSDTGTAWECGYAYAKGKYVFHILAGNTNTYSLMMCNGSDHSCTLGNFLNGETWVSPEINQK